MAFPATARASVLRCALTCLLIGGLVAGCASSNDAAKLINPDPPGKMYARADALLTSGNYTEAAKKFEDLDRDHPYAPEARRAIVMAAYAYYKAGKYPEAIASAKRYTTLHPGTKDAALAHHIIASANFDDIRDPGRDQTATRKALAELKTLVQRYPDSPYTKQAGNRIRIAEDTLAGAEMHIARYYQ
ncbi:MAG TPA: outer membrane protein assembly factor BamD, partial [Xanthobacteraceae bacterium]|nr:outer membrane protein assembly factor BamD [Xanthobacteraceae bacterium]